MYRVIYPFADLLDGSYVYNPGDKFPREGVIVGAERCAELAGANNKIGRPLIAAEKAHIAPAGDKADKIPAAKTKADKKASVAKKPAKKK